MGEVAMIECETHQLGFGEFAEYTYAEILTYKPKFAEFLIDEGKREHIDMREPPGRAMYKDVGVTTGSETGALGRMGNSKTIPTAGGDLDSG